MNIQSYFQNIKYKAYNYQINVYETGNISPDLHNLIYNSNIEFIIYILRGNNKDVRDKSLLDIFYIGINFIIYIILDLNNKKLSIKAISTNISYRKTSDMQKKYHMDLFILKALTALFYLFDL